MLKLHDRELGSLLVIANLVTVALSMRCCWQRWKLEKEQMKWRISPSSAELAIIKLAMGDSDQLVKGLTGKTISSDDVEDEGHKMAADRNILLRQYLLAADDIILSARIGAGSFGEVFKGKVKGAPVAVKVMLSITEKSMREFRAEIILTASLRYIIEFLNIFNLVVGVTFI